MDHDRTAVPLSADEADARARQLITEAYGPPTSYRDETTPPAYGPTPPVPQPGRPPMSQKATDASALMLSGSVAALSVGGATSLVLYTLGTVDPTTLAIGAAGPVALVLAVGSLLRSVGRAKADAHTEHHHHYAGPVRQESTTVSSTTKGLFAKNRNDVR
ncbi:hypothetical protein H9W91_35770 (plasmid) [Streptomyces alfalfae]|uniref:hypothetical protein n=1 Tax=Streptomyces alfalfae TaxID=1642299 RepID=UPI001BAB1620|nr:hypothetical protein [Streptomyces alfalfae]QUI36321.1 hypothetical protein H9W91_35770 [Streptomyces alfalfae]